MFLIRDLEEICGHCFLICEGSVDAVFEDLLEICGLCVLWENLLRS